MEKKELEQLFCEKMGMELERFKSRTLKLEPEQIYAKAYQIDSILCIYEMLLEMSVEMEATVLKALVPFPGLLSYLYGTWLKAEDSRQEEIKSCLQDAILAMCKVYHEIDLEERGEAA